MAQGIILNNHKIIKSSIIIPDVPTPDFPAPGTITLETATLEQISYISQRGLARQYFYLGETKTIWIQTYVNNIIVDAGDFQIRIIGFNHDKLANPEKYGDGTRSTAGITFETVGVLPNKYRFVEPNISNFWEDINNYSPLSNTSGYYDLFDDMYISYQTYSVAPVPVMKEMKEFTNTGVTEYSQRFFALSPDEYGLFLTEEEKPEGEVYEYYYTATNDKRIKLHPTTNTAIPYFTRTYFDSYYNSYPMQDPYNPDISATHITNYDYMYSINTDGSLNTDYPSLSTQRLQNYVAPAFCL